MKTLKFVFYCIFPLFILSGCWDQEEIEERAYVVVLGLDKSEDNLIDVTFQIANPQRATSQEADVQNEPPSDIVTITASDVLDAKELANTIVSREMNFDHLRTMIIEEELAKTELFPHILGSAIVDPEIRRDVNLIVSKEKARKFIDKNKPKLETRPHKYYSFMVRRWIETAYSPQADINRYFLRISDELFLSVLATTEKNEHGPHPNVGYQVGEVPQKGGDPVQMVGSAVFKNGKMIGTLSGRETRIALFLRPKAVTYIQTDTFPDPLDDNSHVTVRIIRNEDAKVKVNAKKDPVEIKVSVPVNLQVFSNPSLNNYTANKKNQELLKESIKKRMEENAMKLVKKTQEEFKGEPFLWYLAARREFWTIQEFEDFAWEKKYLNADVQIDFDMEIESFGEMIEPPKINKHKVD
ncbi:Ger(x)C family spore germination protein [Bacillus niameyensis]|uniref:Ger(x)C family spore germination protein n=1 Tax=Bacillus niameyensis TaxID=1522308 RepID=UPI000783A423|nr:Ger(x)C family spore germination protein [Bacillus niameyensis]